MGQHPKSSQAKITLTTLLVSFSLMACVLRPAPASSPVVVPKGETTELKMQALVMGMADDYIATLGETVYLLTRSGKLDSKGRWLAQSFLRNGVGASLDIAVGPNPSTNLLDILVLASLQTWSFEVHWIPAGIGEAGSPAVPRLKQAEDDLWTTARQVLSEAQLTTLRGLVSAWIAENPDRTVVGLVRFDEFADARKISSLALRTKAQGLLKEVKEASMAVEDFRLLGERLLWYAGRYPYLLGEQAELTAYRLIDQPEGAQLMEVSRSAQRLSDTLTPKIESIQSDLEKQQKTLFSQLAVEREAAIFQLQEALKTVLNRSLEQAEQRLQTQRTEAINQLFDRIGQERNRMFDDFLSRQNEILGLVQELRETIAASGSLANELTGTVNAIDRVVSHFDNGSGSAETPLRMIDIRDAAMETGNAADRVTLLLERTNDLLESKSWDEAAAMLSDPTGEIIDRIFWRGVILICLLLAGLALLRLLPQRKAGR